MPDANWAENQDEITWQHRSTLIDWIIEVHTKFRLVPETLFLAVNIIDRMLSLRHVGLGKLQLVGCTAVFIAAKYEEVMCPSIQNFLYLADSSYSEEEILGAERYVLRTLNFDLSYANPMNFLRRISKADDYDIQTRTVAKFFMEISVVDHRLMSHTPSVIAAAAVWLAREVLERGEWDATLVHYSTFAERELLHTAELMLDYCLRPTSRHPNLTKKYAGKKFMRACPYVINWAHTRWPFAITHSMSEPKAGRPTLVDLYEERGIERPTEREMRVIFGLEAPSPPVLMVSLASSNPNRRTTRSMMEGSDGSSSSSTSRRSALAELDMNGNATAVGEATFDEAESDRRLQKGFDAVDAMMQDAQDSKWVS